MLGLQLIAEKFCMLNHGKILPLSHRCESFDITDKCRPTHSICTWFLRFLWCSNKLNLRLRERIRMHRYRENSCFDWCGAFPSRKRNQLKSTADRSQIIFYWEFIDVPENSLEANAFHCRTIFCRALNKVEALNFPSLFYPLVINSNRCLVSWIRNTHKG